MLWRGSNKSTVLEPPEQIEPGDTLVLPVALGGWMELGHVPEPRLDGPRAADSDLPAIGSSDAARAIDIAEEAFARARAKYSLRLHASLADDSPVGRQTKAILDSFLEFEEGPTQGELAGLLRDVTQNLPEDGSEFRAKLRYFAAGASRFVSEPYPDGQGVVLIARRRTEARKDLMPALDDGEDDASRLGRERPVTLDDHTAHVMATLVQALNSVHITLDNEVYAVAAQRHDWGKADDRFQALLRGTDRNDAWLLVRPSTPLLLAKSAGMPKTPSERKAAHKRSRLPDGFRHEMLSAQIAERAGIPEKVAEERELILHLMEAHHGFARPFAPVALDDEPPDVELRGVLLTGADRKESFPHRLDSGVADRFWALTRRFGWWGLAYLEALLRLADQQASSDEDAGKYDNVIAAESLEANR